MPKEVQNPVKNMTYTQVQQRKLNKMEKQFYDNLAKLKRYNQSREKNLMFIQKSTLTRPFLEYDRKKRSFYEGDPLKNAQIFIKNLKDLNKLMLNLYAIMKIQLSEMKNHMETRKFNRIDKDFHNVTDMTPLFNYPLKYAWNL